MNILLTSVGIRGYLIKYFKKALRNKGKVFATDCSKYAPALYDADGHFFVPPVASGDFIDNVFSLCKRKKIRGIIPLSDLELPLLAKNKHKFMQEGIEVIISNPDVIGLFYDKYKTFEVLEQEGFSTPKTFICLETVLERLKGGKLDFPLLKKLRRGSASKGMEKIYNKEQLLCKCRNEKNIIIQEFILGDEYGVDFLNNRELKPVAVFAKKKIEMRAGETDKAVSVYSMQLIELIKKMAHKFEFYGPVDMDLIKQGDKYLITDINPRIGGGYPLSHALGAGFPTKIISLINHEALKPCHSKYPEGVVMMKQYEIVIKKKI